MKNLKKLILALTLAGQLACENAKEANYTKEPLQSLEEGVNTHKVKLIDDYNKELLEDLTIDFDLFEGSNSINFKNYTQDYNRKDWEGDEKEKIPIPYRYTKLNSEWSEIYIIHSKEVKISNVNQTAFFMPDHLWEELKPYEKHKKAQQLVKGSEKLLNWTLGKIPFSDEVLNIILKKAEKTKQEYYSELLEKTNKNYIIEKIPAYIKLKLIGNIETAREYDITFNVDNLSESSETYLVENIFLGDPSKSSGNSFPNKRGELENIVIKFNLNPLESAEKNENSKSKLTESSETKEFSICVYHEGSKSIDGKSPIEEVIFYIKKENTNWVEFDVSKNECASKKLILEDQTALVEIKATRKFDNGRGNKWIIDYAPKGRKISWNSEKNIELYSNR